MKKKEQSSPCSKLIENTLSCLLQLKDSSPNSFFFSFSFLFFSFLISIVLSESSFYITRETMTNGCAMYFIRKNTKKSEKKENEEYFGDIKWHWNIVCHWSWTNWYTSELCSTYRIQLSIEMLKLQSNSKQKSWNAYIMMKERCSVTQIKKITLI